MYNIPLLLGLRSKAEVHHASVVLSVVGELRESAFAVQTQRDLVARRPLGQGHALDAVVLMAYEAPDEDVACLLELEHTVAAPHAPVRRSAAPQARHAGVLLFVQTTRGGLVRPPAERGPYVFFVVAIDREVQRLGELSIGWCNKNHALSSAFIGRKAMPRRVTHLGSHGLLRERGVVE